MNSMTGHGWGKSVSHGFHVTVEITSTNRKQSEIAIALPRELEPLEERLRDEINRQVARGRLTVRVSLQATSGRAAARVHLDRSLARAYAREFAQLAHDLKLGGPVPLDTVLRAPGVLDSAAEMVEAERFWPAVEAALRQALGRLQRTREREGAHLRRDLSRRIRRMRRAVARVRRRAPQVQARYRAQLLERLRQAGANPATLPPDRLLQEVVLFADRSDITEELTRLESHFQQFEDCCASREPVGRKLDFLAQEMHREINTLGAKANDSLISREVVELKTELEKFREQAQNVE